MSKSIVQKINNLILDIQKLKLISGNYRNIKPISSIDDLKDIPLMGKTDLSIMMPEVRKQAMHSNKNFFLVASGGTTQAPRYSCLPNDFDIERIISDWKPLNNNDIYCNLFKPGKLWAGYDLFNILGSRLAGQTISIGGLKEEELHTWIKFINKEKITAIASTPSTLKNILFFCKENNIKLEYLKKFIWAGEAINKELEQIINDDYPKLETWGLYASMETWVIGLNKPLDTFNEFKIIKDKVIEIIDNEIIVTEISKTSINKILRYKIGDSGEFIDKNRKYIRLLGRYDDSFSFKGQIVYPSDLIGLTNEIIGIENSQIFLPSDNKGNIKQIEVHFTTKKINENYNLIKQIHNNIFKKSMDLNGINSNEIVIKIKEKLKVVDRTGKTYTVYRKHT